MVSLSTARVLARCNGFTVVADREVVGRVATPVFSGTKLLPDYLLVRLAESIPGTFCAIPTALIGDADAESGIVELEIGVDGLRALTEHDV
jgi:hypothetical protein